MNLLRNFLNLSKMEQNWQSKLTAFDAELCKMVESLTGFECEPKNGGDHYFIKCDYSKHNEPEYILAMWDAIEGRTGDRLVGIKDYPEQTCIVAQIKFYSGRCKDAAFIPKHEQK